MELPPEILQDIAQRLPKHNLKQLRLACKRLAESVAPSLFNSVFLSIHPADLESAEFMLAHFGASVKTIIVSPLKYRELSTSRYQSVVRSRIKCLRLPNNSRLDKHLKIGYRLHARLVDIAGRDSSMSGLWDTLQKAFRISLGARKIIITYRHRYQHLTDLELARLCRWKTCPMSRDMHTAFRLDPLHTYSMRACTELGHSLRDILSGSTRNIKELVMEPTTNADLPFFKMCMGDFRLAQATPSILPAMANLTHLCLAINQRHGENRYWTDLIPNFLSQAPNLEKLFLEMVSNRLFRPPTPPSAFYLAFSGYTLPKLKVLVIKGVDMVGDELLLFLAASTGLKHLVIECSQLGSYLWGRLLERIKDETNLDALHLNQLRCGDVTGSIIAELRPDYIDYYGDIGTYLLFGGPNPLSAERLALFTNEEQAGRYDNLSVPQISKEYYEKYF